MALLMYPKVKTVLYIDGITHVPESQDCTIYRWHCSCTRKSNYIHDCEINEKFENNKLEIRGRKSKNDIHYKLQWQKITWTKNK
jgi:hypothetical protein